MGSIMMAVPACNDHALVSRSTRDDRRARLEAAELIGVLQRHGGNHVDAPYRLHRQSMQPCCDKHPVVPRALAGHGFAVGPGRPFDPEELCRRLRDEKRRRDAMEQQHQMEQAEAKLTRQSWQPSTAMRDLFRSSGETRHLRAKSGSAIQSGNEVSSLPALLFPPRPRGDLEKAPGPSFAERLVQRRSVFFDGGRGPSQQPATERAPVAPVAPVSLRRQEQWRLRKVDFVDAAPSTQHLVPPDRGHMMRPRSMGDFAPRAGIRAPPLTRATSDEARPTTQWAPTQHRPDWTPRAADPDRFVLHLDRTRQGQGQDEPATSPGPRVKVGFFRHSLGFLTLPIHNRKTVVELDDDNDNGYERSHHHTRRDVAGESRRASEPWTSMAAVATASTTSPPLNADDGRGRDRRPLRRMMSVMSIFGKRK
ncbi:MAG: hypothetical protein M1815_004987 [Lichina confinis]|nr:MAG: hypothetical protein M1815_004987 [Lichina confinis]